MKCEPQSISDLEKCIVRALKAMKLQAFDNPYMSMPNRAKDVVKCNGRYVNKTF